MTHDPRLNVYVSISRQSDLLAEFEGVGRGQLLIDTYSGRLSALARLPLLLAVRRRFGHYLREHHIDVVYCTMTHIWNLAMLGEIRDAGCRYLLTVHDADLHPGERIVGRSRLVAHEIRSADGIIALTEHVRRQALSLSSQVPNWTIPLGTLGLVSDGRPRMRRAGDPIRLLFFGRLLPYKGLDLLIDAVRILIGRGIDTLLHIAGPGHAPAVPPELRERVSVDCRWIPDDEVPHLFACSDVLVLPYREASQSGSATIAMEAAMPVVATPVGGLAEQVQDHVTGLVAERVSAEAVAESIAAIAADPELYARCSAGALAQSARMDFAVLAPAIAAAILDVSRLERRRP